MLGPWAVSGPAIEIGQQALADEEWTRRTRERLGADAMRLDELLAKAGLDIIGGTSLYRLTQSDEASELFDRLGRAGILVRRFSDQPTWLRWGVPAGDRDWQRLSAALRP
jgi:cobalamin biosynthetic protein CobC